MIDRIGLLGRLVAEEPAARHFQSWDREAGEKVAEFGQALRQDDARLPFIVQAEQQEPATTGAEALPAMPNATVRHGVGVRCSASVD